MLKPLRVHGHQWMFTIGIQIFLREPRLWWRQYGVKNGHNELIDLQESFVTSRKNSFATGMWIILSLVLLRLYLTHWGRVTHICVSKVTIIGSDNGLSPGRRQAIIWTNAGILLIGPWGTNFSEILIGIQTFSFKKIRLKMSSAKCCSFRLGLNVLSDLFITCLCFSSFP